MNDNDELDTLSQKIDAAQRARSTADKDAQAHKDSENKRIGMQAGMELVGAVIAGALLGFGLDRWLGTKPLFIISFLLVGMIVGFYNVYRLTNGHGTAVGYAHTHKRVDKGLSAVEKDAKTRPENE